MGIIAYPIISHEIWKFISHLGELSYKTSLSGIHETEVWDKSHIIWLVVG